MKEVAVIGVGVAGLVLVGAGGALAWWLSARAEGQGLVDTLAAGLGTGAANLADNVKLSEHFTLKELLVSSTASRLGIANVPSPAHLVELRRLANEVLEPVRAMLGVPLRITSGYRSPEVNTALADSGYKPSATSDHMKGAAADFVPIGLDARQAYDTLRAHLQTLPKEQRLPIDQLIFYPVEGHIHVGRRDAPRHEAFVKET